MFAGQKCRIRRNDEQLLEVEIAPNHWHAFASKSDAELVAAAGQMFCEPKPTTSILRATVQAMERAGICQHPDVMVVYDNLVKELRERERRMQ